MYTDEQRRRHIYDLQTFLRRIQRDQGYPNPIAPDGIFGPETAAAVRDFQRQHSLPVTGAADYGTWTAIYQAYRVLLSGDTLPESVTFFPSGAAAELKTGDKGPSVFVLQLMLGTALPHFSISAPVPLTGEYVADTVAGVRRAQGVFLLPQTGVTDRATWEALALFHNSFFGRTPLSWLAAEP